MPYLYRKNQGGRVWVSDEQLAKEAATRKKKREAWHKLHPAAKHNRPKAHEYKSPRYRLALYEAIDIALSHLANAAYVLAKASARLRTNAEKSRRRMAALREKRRK